MRKYVDNSIGHLTPLGMYTNEPSEKTAALSAAKKLSVYGTTEPKYCFTRSGCSFSASLIEQNIMPFSASVALNVVLTLVLSTTASTATFDNAFCSSSGLPSW